MTHPPTGNPATVADATGASTTAVGRGQRDTAIDTLRGICIVMMISSHVAAGSILDKIAHPSVWVDGASGFVLLSGLLVGLVQRSVRERAGDKAGVLKLARRIGIVYAGHMWLCVVAFLVVVLNPARDAKLPSIGDQGGIPGAVWRTLTLQINPYFASILSMYVVLMIMALASIWLLRRGRVVALLAISLILVVFGTMYPELTALPREAGVPGPITLATWHGLFTIGLIAGWFWRTSQARNIMNSRLLLWISILATLAGVVGARIVNRLSGDSSAWMHDLFSKDHMGPGRILVSVLTYYLAYRVLSGISSLVLLQKALKPITFLGTRSLDSYLILSTLVLALPAVWLWDQRSVVAILLAGVVMCLCLAWGRFRASSRLPLVGLARR